MARKTRTPMSRVMLADGSTVGEWIAPQIEQTYQTGKMPALVPGARPALSDGSQR